jgi:hypothetical protein
MKADSLQAIGETLFRTATPEMSPKQLIKAVRKEHPKASKKDIVRGAFYALIAHADREPEKARHLQAFALSERNSDHDEGTLDESEVPEAKAH